jgi:sulfatase modifying factor 1
MDTMQGKGGASPKIVLDMVAVPEGHFIMGTKYSAEDTAEGEETPPHQVWLSAYRIQRTPVTVRQWDIFIAETRYAWSKKAWLDAIREYVTEEPGENYPVTNVSWFDCSAFIEWLQLADGASYALPTEAQWEKACRGTEGQLYPWTRTEPDWREEIYKGRLTLRPVASQPDRASPFGCLDMCDNIGEWCADWYEEEGYEKHVGEGVPRDPRGPGEPSFHRRRAWRGGSPVFGKWARCTYRGSADPAVRDPWTGFRVALST